MTRRPRTRAAAKAKPAPKTAKTSKTKAQAAPKRGTKAASKTPADDKAKRESSTKSAKAAAARKPPAKAPPTKASATKTPPKRAVKTAAAKRPARSGGASKTAVSRAAAGTPKPARSVKGALASTSKAPAAAPRAAAKTKRAGKSPQRAAKTKAPSRRKVAREPAYLAAELGQPVDREGEPIGAGSAMLNGDSALQDYSLRLWRQMQSGGVVNRYMRAIERAGLTVDEVWTAGVIETRSTSSTADEMRRYKQKLLFRANLLEAILSETVADLHRLEGIEPADAPAPPQDAAAGPT